MTSDPEKKNSFPLCLLLLLLLLLSQIHITYMINIRLDDDDNAYINNFDFLLLLFCFVHEMKCNPHTNIK